MWARLPSSPLPGWRSRIGEAATFPLGVTMSQPFRPSALQRRILASLLHLIRTESSRLRALGVTVAPTVTVSDIYTDLAGDRGRSPPIQKVIADELTAVPGVEKIPITSTASTSASVSFARASGGWPSGVGL